MGSGGSESSGKVTNVELNLDRIVRLGFKVLDLLGRKSKGRNSRVDVLNEYWALRFAVLFYEVSLGLVVDNADEVELWLKQVIADLSHGG
jgi:hypothetical protein